MRKLFFILLLIGCLPMCSTWADLVLVEEKPTVYVLTIGISHYRDPQLKLQKAVADSEAVKAALQNQQLGWEKVYVVQLLDEQATRDGIIKAFGQIAQQASPDDIFIFHYSGLSIASQGGNDRVNFILFPHDGNYEKLSETVLTAFEIKKLMAQVASDHQVLIMAAPASSGLFTDLAEIYENRNEQNRGVAVFGNDDAAFGKGSRGHITEAFLLGLSGEADVIMDEKNVITAQEMDAYLPQKVFQLSGGKQRLKSLILGADFPIAKAPGVAPKAGGQGTMKSGIRFAKAPAPPVTEFKKDWKDYALLIGVSEYDDKKNLKFLPNAVPDMESLKTNLETIYGFECKLLQNPKKADVVQALDWYEQNLTDKDRLLVCFSGHGERDEVGEGYLLLKDSAIEGDEKYREYQRALQHSYLNRRLLMLKAHRIMLVLDSCYSGIFENTMKSGERKDEAAYEGIPREELIRRKIFAPSYKWFASGTGPTPDGKPGQHSPFMKAFLESLQTFGGKDSVLLSSEIESELASIDPEPKSGKVEAKEKTSSDFIFIAQDHPANQ